MRVTTPGDSWRPVARGPLFMFAARLAGWDALGELHGLSGFAIARKLQPDGPRVPWRGLALLRDLDADDRTGIVVLVDGRPRAGEDPLSRRCNERLRERMATPNYRTSPHAAADHRTKPTVG